MRIRRIILLGVCGILVIAFGKSLILRAVAEVRRGGEGRKTVAERVAEYGESVERRLVPDFRRCGIAYPPRRVGLIILKAERQVELHASGQDDRPQFIKRYPIQAASGRAGPKLREGDRQVPEGVYRIESLNPNSAFHLSLRVDYPNQFDRAQAKMDGRTELGGDIMIHGGAASIGCVAVGDEAAEELFVLAARTGLPQITVVLSPVDFRVGKVAPRDVPLPPWSEKLYATIRAALTKFPKAD